MILLDTISANAVMASLVSKRIPDKSKAVCDLVTLRRMTSAGQEDREERTLSCHPAFLARNSHLLKRSLVIHSLENNFLRFSCYMPPPCPGSFHPA